MPLGRQVGVFAGADDAARRAAGSGRRWRGGRATRSSRGWFAYALVLVALLAVGCAAGPSLDVPQTVHSAGFWLGLWHGFIAPVTFVISLFTDQVNIYEVHNNGNWYDFGFVLGLLTSLGGPAAGGSRLTPPATAPTTGTART